MIVGVALVGARLGDASQTNWRFYSAFDRILAWFALILAISYLAKRLPKLLITYRFAGLLTIAAMIRVFSIIASPNPSIDVFYILRDGSKQLLSLQNPYEMAYPAPYGVYIPTIVFVYGPLTPFIFLPSVILFNDPRYTLVIADIISAFLIYRLARHLKIDKTITNLIMVIFLFHPLFPFMTEQAWLEPVMTLFLLSAVYLSIKYPKRIFANIFLGAILAVKSVYLLPLLVFLKNQKANIVQYSVTILIPLTLSLPFLLADSKLFLQRTQTYVTDPSVIQTSLAPSHISLSLAAVILKYTGIVLPTFVVAILGLITALVLVTKGPKTPPFALLSAFLVFMVLFMFGPFVFLHYFAFLGNILLLTLLLFLSKRPQFSPPR